MAGNSTCISSREAGNGLSGLRRGTHHGDGGALRSSTAHTQDAVEIEFKAVRLRGEGEIAPASPRTLPSHDDSRVSGVNSRHQTHVGNSG